MSYDEASHHVLHGMPFHGTDAQVRSLRVKLAKTPQFQKWHALDTQVRHVHITAADTLNMFQAVCAHSNTLAKMLAAADYEMLCVLHDLIEEELGQ